MKAVVQRGYGDASVLVHEEVPDPEPGPGEVLVAVAAAGVNRLDVLQREGPPVLAGFHLPHIAGMDIAGSVVGVGANVTGPWTGQRVVVNPSLACGVCAACLAGEDGLCASVRVVGGSCPGGYAQRCVVPADHAFAIPDDLEFEAAASLPTAWATAWHALVGVGRVSDGESVLIHAAGSGLSIAAIQIARHLGARVVATAGSQAKLDLALELGAAAVISNVAYRDGSPEAARAFAAQCREATGGAGADVVLDHVGPALFEASIAALRPRGRLLFCGTTSGTRVSFTLPSVYHAGISLVGVDAYTAAEFAALMDWVAHARPRVVIDSRFALNDAGAAQERLAGGSAIGKVVVLP